MKLMRCAMVCACVLGWNSAVRATETLENIEKACVEKWKDVKSFSAKMTIEMETEYPSPMGQGQKMTMKMKGDGKMESLFKGDTPQIRVEMNMNTDAGGMQMSIKSLSIDDGEFQYSLEEMMGMKQAKKQKSNKDGSQEAFNGKRMFEQLKKDNTLKVLPEEKVDGQDCYVLETSPKNKNRDGTATDPADAMKPDKGRVYIRKSDAVSVKQVAFNKEGKQIMSTSFTEVKINPKIDESRFVFKAPEGVQVVDKTQGGMPKMPGMP